MVIYNSCCLYCEAVVLDLFCFRILILHINNGPKVATQHSIKIVYCTKLTIMFFKIKAFFFFVQDQPMFHYAEIVPA